MCLIHALMRWAFEVGPGVARHTVTSRTPKKVPNVLLLESRLGGRVLPSRGLSLPQARAGDRGLTFSLHHREKQAQGPEDSEIQLFLLLFQFFQLCIILILQWWPEEAREAQG